jgi:pilus assembly protein FimV
VSSETATSSPSQASKKTSKRSKTKPVVETMASNDVTGQEYTTESGDTLAKIAGDMKPEGVSLEQMLVGLYQTNPDAFQGDNMNRLKVGQIIRPPSEEVLNAITRKEASSEIKVQTANWNAYRNKLAGMVAEAAPNDAETSTQSAGGKIKSAAEDKSIPAATGPKDVVKLSAGDAAAAKAGAANVKSLQDRITALQEEATAREKSVKEAQDRAASLEKQIADMQKLLAMKSGAMSELQKQAEIQAAEDKVKAEQDAEQAKVTEANAAKSQAEVPQAKPMESAPVAMEPPKQATTATEKPPKKPATKAVPEPAPEQSFLGSLLDGLDLGILAPAGGLLALLGGGWMYLRKKREKSLADFEQGIMTSGGLKANTVFGNTASASVDTGDTSFLTDFSQSANGGMIDTNDVDPIAEAEVYMAYGRDAQAEEILKDAISKEPKRYELHLKLLEMYAASKNMSAFETISGELYTTLGAEDPTWAKVAEIGIKLEPSNPLYQANSSHASSGSASASGKSADAGEKLDATDFSDSPLAAEKDLDFSFDNDALTQGFAPTGTVKSNEFDMNLDANEDQVEQKVSPDAPAETIQDAGLTFEMDTETEPETTTTADNSGAMEFDMGDLGSFEAGAPVEEQIKTAAEGFSNTMPGLDIPTFAAPHFMPESEHVDELPVFSEAAIETFEFPMVEELAADGVLDISGLAAEHEQSKGNDFSFDVHTIQPEIPSFRISDDSEPNTFDLTTIDLDLNDKADNVNEVTSTDSNISLEVESSEKPSAFASTAAEPIEVDTKLDLVVAYIEMDDKVGAKELLDEVMKEGGTNQRKRAEELLAKLA